jgi:sporulation protein YlmC with PRC-barrel domain
MLIGRDIMDQQVVDADGRLMGKVDGVVLEPHEGEAARLAGLIIGGTTLLWRIHRRLARWAEARLGGEGRITYVPWSKVLKVGVDIKVDVVAAHTPAFHWEEWVREHLIGRIPGA